MAERDHRLNVRISGEELEMLQALAEQRGVSASDVVRMFIREQHELTFGKRKR
jgi:antitoxin component of RelBE/YafQ-DinJ toxin-antitoxin module